MPDRNIVGRLLPSNSAKSAGDTLIEGVNLRLDSHGAARLWLMLLMKEQRLFPMLGIWEEKRGRVLS
jgi:hypothetical protein